MNLIVEEWFPTFKSEKESLENEHCSEKPPTSRKKKMLDRVKQLINKEWVSFMYRFSQFICLRICSWNLYLCCGNRLLQQNSGNILTALRKYLSVHQLIPSFIFTGNPLDLLRAITHPRPFTKDATKSHTDLGAKTTQVPGIHLHHFPVLHDYVHQPHVLGVEGDRSQVGRPQVRGRLCTPPSCPHGSHHPSAGGWNWVLCEQRSSTKSVQCLQGFGCRYSVLRPVVSMTN